MQGYPPVLNPFSMTMNIPAQQLRNELTGQTLELLTVAETFLRLPMEELNWRETPASWSILECLEHLNCYGTYYLPEIASRIHKNKTDTVINRPFKSGLLGNYFANLMRSTKKSSKMKTFKKMNPIGKSLTVSVIHEFIHQQNQMLSLLEQSHYVDLTQTRTSISLSRLITLRLGDTFRFVTYHAQRHMNQAKRAQVAYRSQIAQPVSL